MHTAITPTKPWPCSLTPAAARYNPCFPVLLLIRYSPLLQPSATAHSTPPHLASLCRGPFLPASCAPALPPPSHGPGARVQPTGGTGAPTPDRLQAAGPEPPSVVGWGEGGVAGPEPPSVVGWCGGGGTAGPEPPCDGGAGQVHTI